MPLAPDEAAELELELELEDELELDPDDPEDALELDELPELEELEEDTCCAPPELADACAAAAATCWL